MAEEETKILDMDGRINRLQQTMENLSAHLKSVEEKIDKQAYETKPLWAKAISELEEMNHNFAKLSRKIDVFNSDMLNVRADQREHEERIKRLESEGESRITVIG